MLSLVLDSSSWKLGGLVKEAKAPRSGYGQHKSYGRLLQLESRSAGANHSAGRRMGHGIAATLDRLGSLAHVCHAIYVTIGIKFDRIGAFHKSHFTVISQWGTMASQGR